MASTGPLGSLPPRLPNLVGHRPERTSPNENSERPSSPANIKYQGMLVFADGRKRIQSASSPRRFWDGNACSTY